MDYSVRTVRGWLSRFDTLGAGGLYDTPKPGRPQTEPHLCDIVETDIVETQAGQPPMVDGYLQTVWTVALLALPVCWHCLFVGTACIRAIRRAGQPQHGSAGSAHDPLQLASPLADAGP